MNTAIESPGCPICGDATTRFRKLAAHDLCRCGSCGHSHLAIAEATAQVIYNDHYAGFRSDPVFEVRSRRLLQDLVVPRVRPPARLLDVGCGNGEFLAVARDAGYEVTGVDVSTAARDLCASRGLDVRVGDLRVAEILGEARFDVITFWDVLEHLPDPRSFLRAARNRLRPGGHVLIKTPGTSPTTVRVAAAVPRAAGALLQAPSHVQYFQRPAVDRLLDDAGFAGRQWIDAPAMRAAPTGGRWRRRLARHLVRTFQRVVGDRNLVVIAERA